MIFKLTNTLTFRITFWYTTAFIAFLFAALISSYFLVEKNLDNEINNDLISDITEFNNLYYQGGTNLVINEVQRDFKPEDIDDEFIQILDIHSHAIYSSDVSNWTGLEPDKNIIKTVIKSEPGSKTYTDTIDIPNRDYSIRVAYGTLGTDKLIFIGESLEFNEEIMDILLNLFIVIFLIVTPLASVIVWFVANHAVKGIEEVSRAAIAIKNGYLDHRVFVNDQSDEINNLADTFNSMADRIKELITEMREMIDNIAHDLRSPLSRIRAISEMIISNSDNYTDCKSAAADTLEQCDRLLQYINSTLDVAEAESGVGLLPDEKINLSELVADVCELFEPVAEDKEIEMSVNIEPDCEIPGNKQNLQRMIANLLDNALKYTPSNGRIVFNMEKNIRDIKITVKDSGLGIPVNDQHRVFDRFFRCDHSRSEEGCGLGLSFSRAVARSHGGDITLSSIPGVSSSFIIELPVEYTSN